MIRYYVYPYCYYYYFDRNILNRMNSIVGLSSIFHWKVNLMAMFSSVVNFRQLKVKN